MAVPYIFSTIPNGQTIPLQYLDANFAYIESQIGVGGVVLTLSGGSTGLLPNAPTSGNIILSGTLNIANGGTGETTASGAINALLPTQTGQSGKYLTTDGTVASWAAVTSAVTSFSGGSTGLTPAGVTTGAITLGGVLSISNGGTGASTASGAINALVPVQAGQSGKFLTTNGTTVQWSAAVPGTGTVTSVDVSGGTTGLTTSGGPIIGAGTITLAGTLNVANGGTGATTAQGATTNLLPSQGGHAGEVLSTDGAGVLSWIPTGGVATLDVGTSSVINGSSGNVLYNNAGTLGEISTSGTGSIVLDTNASLTTPTVTKPTLVALREQETSLVIAANSITINCDTATVFYISLNSNITTITFSNVPVAGKAFSVTLSIEADGTPRTITWPASVKWPGGIAPTLTSTAGQTDTFVLYTYDAGTKWFAFVAGQNA